MKPPSRILFVCVENSCRSQIAEAFTGMHGGDSVEAQSAGSRPPGVIHPKAIRAMRERGYDLTLHYSKSLDDIRGPFDAVVTMGCEDACRFVEAGRRIAWKIPDPKDLDQPGMNAIRDQIEEKVRNLIASLRRERCVSTPTLAPAAGPRAMRAPPAPGRRPRQRP